jgi:phosphatidylglycerol:prolipoprotein diacylglycerol transferase
VGFVYSNEGLSTFGVLLGVFSGASFYCWLVGGDYFAILDAISLVAPLSHGLARIGCFVAGCCYGRPIESNIPWAVVFNNPNADLPAAMLGVPLHPTQLYEAAGDIVIAGVLYFWISRKVEKGLIRRGSVFFGFFGGYGLLRFTNDFFRGERPIVANSGLTLAQLVSLVAISAAAMWFLGKAVRKNGKSVNGVTDLHA